MPRPIAALLLLAMLIPLTAAADETVVPITRWLHRGPVPAALPAFHDEETGGFAVKDLLELAGHGAERLVPRDGDDGWRDAETRDWALSFAAEGPAVVEMSAWITADRFTKPELRVSGEHPVAAYLDGKKLKLNEGEEGRTAKLTLQTGKHLLLLVGVFDPETEADWKMGASVAIAEDDAAVVGASLAPARGLQIRDVLDAPKISNVDVSPDGKLVAVSLGAYSPAGGNERWLEIRDVKTGDIVLNWRGSMEAGSLRWLPDAGGFSYTSRDDGKVTIWVHDLATHAVTAAARDLEDYRGYEWNPDGASLVYAFSVEPEGRDDGVKRVGRIEDRWPWDRDRSYLVEVAWPSGAMRRLTAGDVSAGGWTFSPEGTHLLFTRGRPDPLQRPYFTTELWEMDLETLTAEMIIEERWLDDADYAGGRDELLIIGSPSAFGGLGRDLPPGVVPNDYGGQVYLYDRDKGEAEALSVDYDPTVQSAWWHSSGKIVARVLDRQTVHLATCDRRGNWLALDSGVETISNMSLAKDANVAVVVGTGAAEPQKMYRVDVRKGRPKLMLDPGADRYRDVRLGRVEPFPVLLANGEELDGRVHYPLNYDPEQTYPVIVYYYGGTYPITRDFGGRYPKNVWTSRDYFVYVPNPSGALGYGQEYAARHVNDWGKLTAKEVIEGTKRFLDAHQAADRDNVACIGASYGGFLTMYLITQTDMFKCAVSHAGISSISSYWAEGYWGYVYGARALANSFPWSDRELYVEQSPLFHADKIETPLLLLHGFDDTNVPKGESDGLFIALRMLGQEVEYVQVEGQDHHILDHDKRITWNDTILAWFARQLKGQPEWWDEMYGGK